MKLKNILYKGALLTVSALTLASCSDFLDKMPDNRTTMDSPSKIAGLLTTAYNTASPQLMNELMSDNSDYMGPTNSLGNREGDEMYFWEVDKENGNDSPQRIWIHL